MTFGLSSDEWEFLEKLLIRPLKQKGCQVWIFGSRARGDHQKFSDIDILFTENESQPLSVEALSAVKENLEESLLPYKVDLVNSRSLAESYKPYVDKDKVEL